uniref:Uncharacterized protein n=1 Tax=Anopheles maculatus TaxID=74869 RepID=A0A182T7E8_9DIPT
MRREDGMRRRQRTELNRVLVPVYCKRYVMKSSGRDPTERTKALLNSASEQGGSRGGRFCGRLVGLECSTFVVVVAVFGCLVVSTVGDVFTVGYLTGSQRRPGDRVYARPGEYLSKIYAL